MPREYKDLLSDIISATTAIESNVTGLTFDQFEEDTNRVKAVLFDLALIGEASRSIPDEIRAKRPSVAWGQIVGLRNFIAHVYWTIQIEKIWQIAVSDVPELRKQIEELLNELGTE